MDLLHDDYAYEFQIGWSLWELEFQEADPSTPLRAPAQDDMLIARWVREPRLVRVTGFGPLFDEGTYEADGHIRIDFGSDTPFLEEDADLDSVGAQARGRECAATGGADGSGREGFGGDGAAVVVGVGRESCAAAGGTAGSEELRPCDSPLKGCERWCWRRGFCCWWRWACFWAWPNSDIHFNLKELPKRLGVDIQQEANGVTYSHSLGAHSQYKIHASKEVQLKEGIVQLHDVKIELYGEDGSRVDRIAGDEFEYDPKSGKATAAGPVEITLMRPGVAPAIAPKATPDKAVGARRRANRWPRRPRRPLRARSTWRPAG